MLGKGDVRDKQLYIYSYVDHFVTAGPAKGLRSEDLQLLELLSFASVPLLFLGALDLLVLLLSYKEENHTGDRRLREREERQRESREIPEAASSRSPERRPLAGCRKHRAALAGKRARQGSWKT